MFSWKRETLPSLTEMYADADEADHDEKADDRLHRVFLHWPPFSPISLSSGVQHALVEPAFRLSGRCRL